MLEKEPSTAGGLPAQERAAGLFFGFGKERKSTVDASSEPLVSIVIPTFERPAYFREALRSVVNQTYQNLDIFITDNSHNEETKRIYEEEFANDRRILYEHHPDFDAQQNWARAIDYDNLDAPYVNWLMDDDLFFPDKIERMVKMFLQYPDVTLVTSVRQPIDSEGNKITGAALCKPFVSELTHMDGRDLGRYILTNIKNMLGEPTTVMIKKSAMHNHRLGWTGKEGKYLVSDFPTWLCALSKGNCIYFPEPLSAFRVHAGQQQRSLKTQLACVIGWAMAIREAIDRDIFLRDTKERRQSIIRWIAVATADFLDLPEEAWEWQVTKDLHTVFVEMVAALRTGGPIAFDIDTGAV